MFRTCPKTTPTRSVSEDDSRATSVLAHASGWCCSKHGVILGQVLSGRLWDGTIFILGDTVLGLLRSRARLSAGRADGMSVWRWPTKSRRRGQCATATARSQTHWLKRRIACERKQRPTASCCCNGYSTSRSIVLSAMARIGGQCRPNERPSEFSAATWRCSTSDNLVRMQTPCL